MHVLGFSAYERFIDLDFTAKFFFQRTVLHYETDAEVPGKYGNLVRVDLLVAAKLPSLVLAWSSGSSSQAHITQNEIFRKWSDLDKRLEQRVTIFDDRFDVYKGEDLKRIQSISQLVAISDRATFKAILLAA